MQEIIIPVMQLPQGNAAGADSFLLEVRHTVRSMLRPAVILEVPANARLDSFAIDFVIRSASEAATYDAEIALVATSPEHRLLLDVTRFSNVLPVFSSVEEAVAHLEKHLKPSLADRMTTPMPPVAIA
jgi:anti-anti-sigma regulatory factor